MRAATKQFLKWLIIINAVVFALFFIGGAALVVPTCTFNCEELANSFGQVYAQLFLAGNILALVYYFWKVHKKA